MPWFSLENQERYALLATAFLFPAGGATLVLPWLLALSIGRMARERRLVWVRSPLDAPLAAFLGWALIAGLRSPIPTVAVPSWALAVLAFGVVLQAALCVLRGAPGLVRSLHRAFALGTLTAALFGLVMLFTEHLTRAEVPAIGPNALGFGLMAGIYPTLPLLSSGRPWSGVAVLTLVAATTTIIATLSRGALYGLVVGGICYLLLERRRLSRRTVAVVGACAAVGILLAVVTSLITGSLAAQLASELTLHRPATIHLPRESNLRAPVGGFALPTKAIEYLFSENGYGDRIFIWKTALAMIRDRPLVGVGLGVFPFVAFQWNRDLPPGMPPHSLYVGMAAETGIPGAVAFFWLLFAAIWSALQRRGLYRDAALAAMAGMLAAEIRDNILFGFHMAIGFTVILAMLVAPAGLDGAPRMRKDPHRGADSGAQ